MTNFLIEFMEYFFPSINQYPDWLQVFLGCFILCFVFRLICVLINSFGGKRL